MGLYISGSGFNSGREEFLRLLNNGSLPPRNKPEKPDLWQDESNSTNFHIEYPQFPPGRINFGFSSEPVEVEFDGDDSWAEDDKPSPWAESLSLGDDGLETPWSQFERDREEIEWAEELSGIKFVGNSDLSPEEMANCSNECPFIPEGFTLPEKENLSPDLLDGVFGSERFLDALAFGFVFEENELG